MIYNIVRYYIPEVTIVDTSKPEHFNSQINIPTSRDRITHLTASFKESLPPSSEVSSWGFTASCWNEETIKMR
jgi:hypothetical protein